MGWRGVALLAAAGGLYSAVGAAFAWHSCRVVFNRHPPLRLHALRRLLLVTRPLGISWRLLTAPLRSLPDVYVIGEARCGTTTLAALLRDRLGMAGPFTPWVHPLADNKESFYFAGHYWRVVLPALYRLCFPLRVSRWFHRVVLRRPFLVFDGCASHLSASWTPALLKRVTPAPLIIVCLREPVSQHISWWQLEQSSDAWAKSMGLGDKYLSAPSRIRYPPATLREAIDLSRAPDVKARWHVADGLGAGVFPILPEWAAPFPNGQLSAFDRMGRYADSIGRWLAHFDEGRFLFVALDELSADPQKVLRRIAERLGLPTDGLECSLPAPKLNASGAGSLQPDDALLSELGAYYRPHNERLFKLIGRDLGWHSDQRYWWYRT
ncbi:hypothetical protein AB1Y20_003248 [Prymnesium parvum]|uniref:Sulfotransferase domain-containing protein n=1 Tax=Prymnesium parvum TaxID=97485 RepID=A0AB34JEA6_PRYPA